MYYVDTLGDLCSAGNYCPTPVPVGLRAVVTISTDDLLYKIETKTDGNVLTLKDYTFTMPNSNVTIEVTFEVESPKTTTANITIAIILICISLIIIIKYKTKGKWLNN